MEVFIYIALGIATLGLLDWFFEEGWTYFFPAVRKRRQKALEERIKKNKEREEREKQGKRQARMEAEKKLEEEKQKEQEKQRQFESRDNQLRQFLSNEGDRENFLESIDPLEFEKVVLNLYKAQGYAIEPTKGTGDSGIDGIIKKERETIAIQCKHQKSPVSEPTVRNLMGSLNKIRAKKGIFVTSSFFTGPATEWARSMPLELIDRTALLSLMKQYFKPEFVFSEHFSSLNSDIFKLPKIPECCGLSMKLISGKYGVFWGCSKWPECRETYACSEYDIQLIKKGYLPKPRSLKRRKRRLF